MTHVQKETAILLKEKGYNLLGNYFYLSSGKLTWFDMNNWNQDKSEQIYSAPTLHESTDWLRETKGVHVAALPAEQKFNSRLWIYAIFTKDIDGYYNHNWTGGSGVFQTHDLALEAGIVHALKHYVK